MTHVHIRRARAGDAAAITALLTDSFAEYRARYTPKAFAATTPSADTILNRLEEGPVWVAVRHDQMVGTISAVPQERGLYIRSMAVRPSARGLGIGELLLRHVEQFARQNQTRRLFLSTTPFLGPAIRLYERFGFRPSGEGPHDLHGTPLFTMEMLLEPRTESGPSAGHGTITPG